jgi:hypothetical protein
MSYELFTISFWLVSSEDILLPNSQSIYTHGLTLGAYTKDTPERGYGGEHALPPHNICSVHQQATGGIGVPHGHTA